MTFRHYFPRYLVIGLSGALIGYLAMTVAGVGFWAAMACVPLIALAESVVFDLLAKRRTRS